jgi:DNA polymerase-3 subunit epsilon
MTSEQLGELFGRIQAGLRRSLKKGALLADPTMLALHQRLRQLEPKRLTRRTIAATRFVIIDTETTGLHAYAGDEICSIALLEMQGLELTGREFNSLINPGRRISERSSRIHRLTDETVKDAPVIEQALPAITEFIGESVIVGHHVGFDIRFLNKTLQKALLCRLRHPWLDTMLLFLASSGRVGHYTLEQVAAHNQVEIRRRHTAYGDAMATAQIFKKLASRLAEYDNPVQRLIDRQFELGHF